MIFPELSGSPSSFGIHGFKQTSLNSLEFSWHFRGEGFWVPDAFSADDDVDMLGSNAMPYDPGIFCYFQICVAGGCLQWVL